MMVQQNRNAVVSTDFVLYSHMPYHNNTTIIKQTHNDKVARTNDARKEDAGRLLYKIFYLTSLFVSFERVVPSLRVRGSWRPNITEIFWPRSYGCQRCVFLVLHGYSTGALAFLTTSRLPPQLYSPVSTGSLNLTDRNSTPLFNSSALYYLQTPTRWYGHASATPSDI